ncbi:hypothetical protein E7T06_18415 [Deinococcus sp. Arct2-2]|uniref:hypothetical protein n=1 Tax=Deinococcus sp. Arct2-2 TaxID=2568653 RepID=UPI0010A390E3|nr:hypothetical protein [Deinococcus sp. Arct2-2]THF68014.1 hypothetical protein E7T06_18415 [Deinococcus sp. Arct2-2]
MNRTRRWWTIARLGSRITLACVLLWMGTRTEGAPYQTRLTKVLIACEAHMRAHHDGAIRVDVSGGDAVRTVVKKNQDPLGRFPIDRAVVGAHQRVLPVGVHDQAGPKHRLDAYLVESGQFRNVQYGFPLPYKQSSPIASSQNVYCVIPLVFDLVVYILLSTLTLLPFRNMLAYKSPLKPIMIALGVITGVILTGLILDMMFGQFFLVSPFKVLRYHHRMIRLGL